MEVLWLEKRMAVVGCWGEDTEQLSCFHEGRPLHSCKQP